MARKFDEFKPTAEMLERAAAIKVDTPRLKLPKKYLSHSQIDMYLRCPRQYYFRYVRDEKRPPGSALVLGIGTHSALELTHHHIVDKQTPAPTEAILDKFSEAFDEKSQELGVDGWIKEDVKEGEVKDIGVQLVKIYNTRVAPRVQPQVTGSVRGIEKKFSLTIAGVPVMGYIDLIDTNDPFTVSETEREMLQKKGKDVPIEQRTFITDFKTRAKSASASEIDGSLQLTLYSYAEKIPAVRFDQLLKQKVPKVKRARSIRQKSDYLWLKEVVSSVARAISAGIFPPCSPTDWVCSQKWCGYWHMCRGKR